MTLNLDGLRAAGLARFSRLGMPNRRQEAWRFTDLRPLTRHNFQPAAIATDSALAASVLTHGILPTPLTGDTPDSEPLRLVLVNGQWCPTLSNLTGLPAGVVLTGLDAALTRHPELVAVCLGQHATADDHPMVALNASVLGHGAVLSLPANVHLTRPIELVFVGIGGDTPTSWQPRVLISVGTGSVATVVEHHISLNGGITFHNGVTEIALAAGARLNHYKAQRQNHQAIHLATLAATLAASACYEGFLLTTGGRLTRNDVRLTLTGLGATAHLNGAYMVRGDQHCDLTTVIDHASPQGSSRQLVKGVIDDQAGAVFQGKALVRPGAQKTDAHQLNRTLLLSDQARIDAKPELEIYADDVKCGHGATVGDLDDDALFYLRARGIDRDSARALLIAAFITEAVAEISCDPVRTTFEALTTDWLVNKVS